jgi:hypothetical protein
MPRVPPLLSGQTLPLIRPYAENCFVGGVAMGQKKHASKAKPKVRSFVPGNLVEQMTEIYKLRRRVRLAGLVRAAPKASAIGN